jgi:hypothetical protein
MERQKDPSEVRQVGVPEGESQQAMAQLAQVAMQLRGDSKRNLKRSLMMPRGFSMQCGIGSSRSEIQAMRRMMSSSAQEQRRL